MYEFSLSKKLSGLNIYYLAIIAVGLFATSCYYYEWYQYAQDRPLFPEHASQLAYNFYTYNTLNYLYESARYEDHGVVGVGSVVNRLPDIRDTIGYAFLLGLSWKLTGTTKFYWVSFLQICLFILSLCLLFQMLWWFYDDRTKALYGTLGILAFLPLAFISVQPVKDIWSFFATAALVWVIMGSIKNKLQRKHIIATAVFFAVCQWLRPTVFGVLGALVFLGLPFFYWYNKNDFKKIKQIAFWFVCANIFIFWLPWIAYNKSTYNRYFVGPSGLALITSLGERKNPWGFDASEVGFEKAVRERYPHTTYVNGTQEFDDLGKQLFIECFKQNPMIYVINLGYRLKKIVMRNMPLMASFWHYAQYRSKIEALKMHIQNGFVETLKFCIYVFYTRSFLLFSYIGLVLFLKRYSLLLPILVGIAVFGNCGELLSHLEDKYLMQCYGFLGIFFGFFIFWLQNIVMAQIKKRHVKKVTS